MLHCRQATCVAELVKIRPLWLFPAMGLVLLGIVTLPTILLLCPLPLVLFILAGKVGMKAFGWHKKTFISTTPGKRGGTFYVRR